MIGLVFIVTLMVGMTEHPLPGKFFFQRASEGQAPSELQLKSLPDGKVRVVLTNLSYQPHGVVDFGDCTIVAEGRLTGHRLVANVVPFILGDMSATTKDLLEQPARVIVRFRGRYADVQDNFQGCGLRVFVNGRYHRTSHTALRPPPSRKPRR